MIIRIVPNVEQASSLSEEFDSQQEELGRSISMFNSKDSLFTLLRIKGLNGEEALATIERSTELVKLLQAYESRTKSNIMFRDSVSLDLTGDGDTPESLGLHGD